MLSDAEVSTLPRKPEIAVELLPLGGSVAADPRACEWSPGRVEYFGRARLPQWICALKTRRGYFTTSAVRSLVIR